MNLSPSIFSRDENILSRAQGRAQRKVNDGSWRLLETGNIPYGHMETGHQDHICPFSLAACRSTR